MASRGLQAPLGAESGGHHPPLVEAHLPAPGVVRHQEAPAGAQAGQEAHQGREADPLPAYRPD